MGPGPRVVTLLLSAAVSAGAAACKSDSSLAVTGDGGIGGGGGAQGSNAAQIEILLDAMAVRKLDLVIVVDNSAGMGPKQNAFAAALPALLTELRRGPGGLPDLRVAVVSSDVGAGPEPVGTCQYVGDRGRFLVRDGCGLDKSNAHWLAAQEDGTKTNVRGRIEDVLACLVKLGEGGCAFGHHLQALRAALSTENAENQGFLRPDAHLGVIILADEDDCSASPGTDLFLVTPAGQAPRLVCALEGHTCNAAKVAPAALTAPLAACAATPAGQTKLIPVEEIVSHVRAIKAPRSDGVSVAAVVGWSEAADATYAIARNARGELEQAPLCNPALGPAAPALRLKAFADAFAPRAFVKSLCSGDVTAALADIGRALNSETSPGCLPAGLADADPVMAGPQAVCAAGDRRVQGAGFAETPIPACKAGGPRPCLELVADGSCAGGVRAVVNRDGASPSPGTFVSLKCLASPPAAGPGGAPGAAGSLGRGCAIAEAASAGPSVSLIRSPALECSSQICLRPARDAALARAVDTGPLCAQHCENDADCERGDLRAPSDPSDRRCRTRFACAVPFEVGPWACRRLCTCQDFFASAPIVPVSCRM